MLTRTSPFVLGNPPLAQEREREMGLAVGLAGDDAPAPPILRDPARLKIAIVHYWLVGPGGGENVVRAMLEVFPQADVFTLVCRPAYAHTLVAPERLRVSMLQRIPGVARFYRSLLLLMPAALENFDLTGYDLVISSESGPAKGVLPALNALHICYCHSPMRYLWDQYQDTGGRWAGSVARS